MGKYFYQMEIGIKESGLRIKEKVKENKMKVKQYTLDISKTMKSMVMVLLQKITTKDKWNLTKESQ